MGTVYLIHIEPPYRHAKHYLGYTGADETGQRRFDRHLAGRGSPLIKAALAAGSTCEIVRLWSDADRTTERQLKLQKNAPHLCPVCRAKRNLTNGEAHGNDANRKQDYQDRKSVP